MNKKIKLLTSTLCGVILASSLSFMNVKAAPVQNNVKANIDSLSANSIISLSPAISKNGVLYWTPQKNADNYMYNIYNQTSPWYNQNTTGGDVTVDNYINIKSVGFTNNSMAHANCTYKVLLTAFDRNHNVLNTATLYFYYDGSTFTQQ